MQEKKRNIKSRNIIELILGLSIIVLINLIGSYAFSRWDLTSEKRYSLSDASKEVLSKVDDVVFFKVYLEGDFPSGFERLSRATREMLDEFRAYNKNIEYEFINPNDLADNKDINAFYQELVRKGLNPTDLQVRTTDGSRQQLIFPGAVLSYKSREIPLNLLQSQLGKSPEAVLNSSIQELEYNIASAIRKISVNTKPRIAFIEGHGELQSIFVYDITKSLSEYYQVERLRIDEKISALNERDTSSSGEVIIRNKYKAIIVAGPDSSFSEKDKFIIDQYIMRGGKALWLIDPVYASMDSLEKSSKTIGMANDINLDDMFFKYGIRLNPVLVQDINALPIRIVTGQIGDQPKIDFLPWYFFPIAIPKVSHPLVTNLNAVKFEFAGTIDTIETKGIKKTILLSTSDYSRTLKAPVLIDLGILKDDPDKRLFRKKNLTLGVLLEGSFESVFNNRITPEITNSPLIDFQEKSIPTAMIIFSDGDVIRNQLHSRESYPLPLGFDQYTRQSFGNRDLIMNAINYLCDDSGLIVSRTKDIQLRMLDPTKTKSQKLYWQILNTVLPLVIVLLAGIIIFSIRKRKYGIRKN